VFRICLQAWLDRTGVSIYRLALNTKLSEMTLRNIRDGKTKGIDLKTLYLLCEEFECTPNDLIVLAEEGKKGGRKANV
jgi:DNA-binding Xre family transcriptional regulator